METLITERLTLRAVAEEDDRDIFEYSKNPKVGIDAGWKPHESLEETRQIIKSVFLGQENVWGIVLKESGKLIGTIGLIDDPARENPNVRMLGYAIGEEYWGKGIATESAGKVIEYGFTALNLSGISVTCYDYNKASEGVIKKCGFVYEGMLKLADLRFDGKVLDKKCFFMDRNAFFK